MESTLTITQARAKLLHMPETLARDKETKAVTVTRRGKPVLAIVDWSLYESVIETLEILGDPELSAALRAGIKEAESGVTVAWSRIKRELRA